ncbi:hypothetical protein ABNG03_03435 [Halorubrum sp. RMP-47]|uniref:Helix-turn-helix domain-containing protein n=1 Tax=Halorubrum miltondacostae TaxID=3076378 RepID=A0ABD5M302_9EURY
MGQTPSDRLDTVATVAAAIEAAGNEITDLRAAADNDTGRGTVHISLPIVSTGVESPCEFDLVAATLVDGTLQLELDVVTDPSKTTSDETTSLAATRSDSTDRNNSAQTVAADQSPASEHSPNKDDSTSPVDETVESTNDAAATGSDVSADDDLPPYRDPDRLAAVYDPDATFAEMTDALGVDVTPQTVRRYMIEHDVHEPTSQASDTLAATDAPEVTNEGTDDEPDAETTAHEETVSQPTSTTPASSETASTGGAPVDIEAEDTGETTTSDGPETQTLKQPDTADESTEPATGDTTASMPTEDKTDDTVTGPSDESARDSPTSTSTATDGGTQPTLSAVEPIELPDGVSASELVAVLTDSRTVYEVRRGLGVTDDQARTILRQYGLIDLVTGRITQGSDPPSEQEVLSRLAEVSDRAA